MELVGVLAAAAGADDEADGDAGDSEGDLGDGPGEAHQIAGYVVSRSAPAYGVLGRIQSKLVDGQSARGFLGHRVYLRFMLAREWRVANQLSCRARLWSRESAVTDMLDPPMSVSAWHSEFVDCRPCLYGLVCCDDCSEASRLRDHARLVAHETGPIPYSR